MTHTPFAFHVTEAVTGEVADITGSYYDPQQQLWVGRSGSAAVSCANNFTQYCTCCIDGCTMPDADCFTTVDGVGSCPGCG